MADAYIEWRAVDPTARGPRGVVVVGPEHLKRWTWGRTWTDQTVTHAVSRMPETLSATAVTVVGDLQNKGHVTVATQQGSARGDVQGFGHVEVFSREGGPRLHRLTGRTVDAVPLRSGHYRLDLYLNDLYCQVFLSFDAGSRRVPDRGRGSITGHWPLTTYFEVPSTTHAELAVSLLAMAAVHFDDLRGDRKPYPFFLELLSLTLGEKKTFGDSRIRSAKGRLPYPVAPGTAGFTEVARYRYERLEQWQRDTVHAYLAAMLT